MCRTRRVIGLLLGAGVLLVACGVKDSFSSIKEIWNSDNQPSWFDPQVVTNFQSLPLSGMLDFIPWSGSTWSSNDGGLALRWLIPGADAWSSPLHSLDELRSMSYDDIARLSPAEKYDIYSNDYNYSLTKSERMRVSPSDPGWYGLCHGLSQASLLHTEPRAIVVNNAAGIPVAFSSADIKGLLTLMYGTTSSAIADWRYIGVRCNGSSGANSGDAADDACRDSNAGGFHVALANEIGLHKRGFIIDRTRGEAIWNRPVFGYSSSVVGEQAPSEGAAPGTVRELVMATSLHTTKASGEYWNALGRDRTPTGVDEYRYRLELNSSGDIIGGEWITWDRPDFAWKPLNTSVEAYMVGSFANMRTIMAALATAPGARQPGTVWNPTPVPTGVPTAAPTATPTGVPTPVPTVVPFPGPVGLDTETIVVDGEYRFDVKIRRERGYLASEWIELQGRVLDSLAPSGRVELFNGSQLLAKSLTHINTGAYTLRFRLPVGGYSSLDLRLVDARSGAVWSKTRVSLVVRDQ